MRYEPRFELTIYGPDGVTPLTPRPGSAHSDPFVVTTRDGEIGAKPYLEWPSGRAASIDPFTKKRTIGTLRLRILDKRVGTDNLERWVTAFLGDAKGANQLAGALARVRAWDPDLADWTPWWRGRVTADQLSGALHYDLTISDRSADLDVEVFAGPVSDTVASYARQAQLLPLGLLQPYGEFPRTTRVRASVKDHFLSGEGFVLTVDQKNGDGRRLVVTEMLRAIDAVHGRLGLKLTPIGGGVATHWFTRVLPRDGSRVQELLAYQRQGASTPLPAIATAFDCEVYALNEPASEAVPIIIGDVHPVTHLRRLAEGHFGRLEDDGTPRSSVPVGASFAALEADQSFGRYRCQITKKTTLALAFEDVCRQFGLAYDLTPEGTLELYDLRRKSTVSIAATLTEADRVLEAGPPRWSHNARAAKPVLVASYFAERYVTDEEVPEPPNVIWGRNGPANVPASRVVAQEIVAQILVDQAAIATGVSVKDERIVATGYRFAAAKVKTTHVGPEPDSPELLSGRPRNLYLQQQLGELLADLQAPYSRGETHIDVVCRLASANVKAVVPGRYAILDFDVVPDPATNRRGGPRLALCLSREHDGLQVKLRFLDVGESGVALPPMIGSPALVPDDPNAMDVDVTPTPHDPARVDVAYTATTQLVPPPDIDPAWRRAALVEAAGTLRISQGPSGRRAWVRARSEPRGERLRIPSDWMLPAGTKYVDLAAIAPPSGLSVDTPSADLTALEWTNGDAAYPIEVLLTVGAAPASWGVEHRVALLDAGSVKCPLGLMTPLVAGETYTVAVRHTDAFGGVSTAAAETFVAGGDGMLSSPAFEVGFCGSIDPITGVPVMDGTFGLAVIAVARPGFVEFEVAVETAVASGAYGAWLPLGKEPAKQGAWTVARGVAPNDQLRRKLRARSVRDGATPSVYTDEITVRPWTLLGLPAFPSTPVCRVRVLEPDPPGDAATLVRCQVDLIDPTGDAGQVRLAALTANSSVASGAAVGVAVASGGIWKLARPDRDAGQGEAVFEAIGQSGTIEKTLTLFEQGTLPRLEVQATHGASNYTITWTGINVELSVNGGAFGPPPASPFVVARNAAGGAYKEYRFRSIIGADSIINTVAIPPIDADTVTPTLDDGVGVATDTQVPFTPIASDPRDGTPLNISVTLIGCTAVIGGVTYGPNDTVVVASGTAVMANRPAFGSPQASIVFRASIGGAFEEIGRTIKNQDKLSFGPSIELDVTPGSTSYTIGYSATGVVGYRIDGGGWSAPPSNPFVVSRNAPGGADKVVQVRATLDGQSIAEPVTVPAQPASASTSVQLEAPILSINTVADEFIVSINSSPLPSGAYYQVMWYDTADWEDWLAGGDSTNSTTQAITPAQHGYNLQPGTNFTLYVVVYAYDSMGNQLGVSPTTSKRFSKL